MGLERVGVFAMTVKGHFKNGSVVLEEGAPSVPDGTLVDVLIPDEVAKSGRKLSELFEGLIGSIDGPSDFAENHDHYIHGTPKRNRDK